jgi:uncharacterized OB-fold protein
VAPTEPSIKAFRNMPPPGLTDPLADELTQPYWDAMQQQQLVGPQCGSCGTFRMPPSTFCSKCLSEDLQYTPLPGTGTVFTFVIVRHPLSPSVSDYVPFMPAAIDADGAPGIRFISNVVDCEPEDVSIGMTVKVVWHQASDTLTLPFWAPA